MRFQNANIYSSFVIEESHTMEICSGELRDKHVIQSVLAVISPR